MVGTVKGAELGGLQYIPLFKYYESAPGNPFRVLVDTYVTSDTGTGIVHCAPAFGEDDYRVCLAAGVISKGEGTLSPWVYSAGSCDEVGGAVVCATGCLIGFRCRCIACADIPCPVNDNGLYTAPVTDYLGRHVKECDKDITKRLTQEGRVMATGEIVHSYPFCWRYVPLSRGGGGCVVQGGGERSNAG